MSVMMCVAIELCIDCQHTLSFFLFQGITVVNPETVFHAASKTSFERGSDQSC